jgi:hypothetical protein
LEEPVAETAVLGHPGDKMTKAALDHIVVDIAHLGHLEDKMTAAALDHIVVGIAAPGMAVDTSAAGGMVVVGTVVTSWLLLCTASIPIHLLLS